MMVTRKEKPEGFRPVTLEITFETVAELKTLWNQLNTTSIEISDHSINDGRYSLEVVEVSRGDLFSEISEVLYEL